MAVKETSTFVLVCDECGYPGVETDERSKARDLAHSDDVMKWHVVDGRDVCHDCTEEGKAESREHLIQLAIYSWRYDGVTPEAARAVAEAMLDRGTFPPPETPVEAIRASIGSEEPTGRGGVLALVFRDCLECGEAVACKYGSGSPRSCSQHN